MQRPEITRHPQLEERTIQYGILCLWLCEQLPQGYAGRNLADQLFRSATSVAANYAEATEPESDADFIHKLKVSLKELKESRAWLMFVRELLHDPFVDSVISESVEIQRMIGASLKKRGYTGWSSKPNTKPIPKTLPPED